MMKNEIMLYVFIAFSTLAFLFWSVRWIYRNFSDRKRWNYGQCRKCGGRYKKLESGTVYECDGVWYRCGKCSYVICAECNSKIVTLQLGDR